jgi:hypothetical protein
MHHRKLQGDIESKNIGINQKGGGGKGKLEIKQQVCLCLFYLTKMPTFEALSSHFGIWKTEAKDTFHDWLEILRDVSPPSLREQLEKHDRDYTCHVHRTIDGVSLNSGQHGTPMRRTFR